MRAHRLPAKAPERDGLKKGTLPLFVGRFDRIPNPAGGPGTWALAVPLP